jgi:hypothetical protein
VWLFQDDAVKAPGLAFDLCVDLDFDLNLNLNVVSTLDAFRGLQSLRNSGIKWGPQSKRNDFVQVHVQVNVQVHANVEVKREPRRLDGVVLKEPHP